MNAETVGILRQVSRVTVDFSSRGPKCDSSIKCKNILSRGERATLSHNYHFIYVSDASRVLSCLCSSSPGSFYFLWLSPGLNS